MGIFRRLIWTLSGARQIVGWLRPTVSGEVSSRELWANHRDLRWVRFLNSGLAVASAFESARELGFATDEIKEWLRPAY